MFWIVTIYLLTVHAPDGQEIIVNATEISSIRKPRDGAEENFAKGTNCILTMTNGKIISTIERCIDVIKTIREIDVEEGKT